MKLVTLAQVEARVQLEKQVKMVPLEARVKLVTLDQLEARVRLVQVELKV